MAKKRVSADELNWIVTQELGADTENPQRLPLAVIPDEKKGWRILLPKPTGRDQTLSKIRKLVPAVERRLRESFTLKIS